GCTHIACQFDGIYRRPVQRVGHLRGGETGARKAYLEAGWCRLANAGNAAQTLRCAYIHNALLYPNVSDLAGQANAVPGLYARRRARLAVRRMRCPLRSKAREATTMPQPQPDPQAQTQLMTRHRTVSVYSVFTARPDQFATASRRTAKLPDSLEEKLKSC